MIKLSDYIIKELEENTNAKHMFMLPGGGAMHLNDSLGKSKKIKYVVCLHEQALSIAAESYARVTNDIGLCMVTTGPGGTNAMTGLAGAYIESTPVFFVSGQVKRADMINGQGIRQQGMQELNIIDVVKPITKYAYCITNEKEIMYHMKKALYLATHGRKGPVWLDIPLDVQSAMIDEKEIEDVYQKMKKDNDYEYKDIDSKETIDKIEQEVLKVIDLLNKSERPVILIGNGIRLSGALDLVDEFLDALNIPVITTWNGIDLIDENNKYYFGRPGGLGSRFANLIEQNSDFHLTVGARLNLLQTGYNHEGLAKKATKIMVDIDEKEMGKINVHPDIKIHADAKIFIEQILKHKDKIQKKERRDWFEYATKAKKAFPVIKEDYYKQEKINTYLLVDKISDVMSKDDVYVSGSSGSAIDISMQALKIKKGMRAYATKGLASMGYGLPSTIGAAFASGHKVMSVQGDGGFMMNIQELATIKANKLPIKIFVLCNGGYGAIKNTQTNMFNEHFVACDDSSGLYLPDIKKVVEGFDIKTFVINKNSELDTVAKAYDYDGPVVVICNTDISLVSNTKQITHKNPDGTLVSMPIEYMAPELSEEEMKRWMI